VKLIFNADDFGHTKAVNLGILEAYFNGLVRSTSIMAGKPGFDHAVTLARIAPGLKIGVHLTLTSGKSVGGAYDTLTDGSGNFIRPPEEVARRAREGLLDLGEVETEFEAQIQKCLAAGLKPDHFDGHHHVQNLPGIVDVYLKFARKYGVKVRLYDHSLLRGEYACVGAAGLFSDGFYDETATAAALKEILSAAAGADSLEVMCHPGYVDWALYTGSVYNINRTRELQILTSDEMRSFVADSGFELCSFSDL